MKNILHLILSALIAGNICAQTTGQVQFNQFNGTSFDENWVGGTNALFGLDSMGQVIALPNTNLLSTLGITASATELNYVDGVTGPIQTQLNTIPVSGVGGYQPYSSELATFSSNGSSFYLNRSNHTGMQAQATVIDLESDLAGKQPVSGISSGGWIANNPSGSGRWMLNAGGVDEDADATVSFPYGASGTVGVFNDSQGYPSLDNEVTGVLPLDKLTNLNGLSVLGRSANSVGAMAAITAGTDGHVLRRSGTSLGFGALAAGAFADNTIAPARLTNGTALSILGRSANSSGARADIAAASDHQVMRRSGTAVGFGAINLASANAVTGSLADGNIASAGTWNAKIGGTVGTVDNAIVRADGTGGVQSSLAKVEDNGGITVPNNAGFMNQFGHGMFMGSSTRFGLNNEAGTGPFLQIYSPFSRYDGAYVHSAYTDAPMLGFATWNGTPDVRLVRIAAGHLGLENGSNPQQFTIYGSYTNDTNLEGVTIGHDGTAAFIQS